MFIIIYKYSVRQLTLLQCLPTYIGSNFLSNKSEEFNVLLLSQLYSAQRLPSKPGRLNIYEARVSI